MRPVTRTIALAATAALLGGLPLASQTPVQRVTSDTAEYCQHLVDRVSELVRIAAAPPPEEVTVLSSEGRRMCDEGKTRGGILRLRRAFVLMTRQGNDRP